MIDRVLAFDEAGDAHRQMEAGEAFGKILLVPTARA
ncbi:MAG: zinc-binding dehydrogenase [Candidatus Dormiibacterota bacterium]